MLNPTPLPNDNVLFFTVDPETVDLYWMNAIDVLNYLIDHPNIRQVILSEIAKRSNRTIREFHVYHPLLNFDIILSSRHNDLAFVVILTALRTLETPI